MEAPLEEIEFLARSTNRVEVLQLLATRPHTRRSLATATGASQATLGRILEDFAERSWVRHDGSEYVATATGGLVADGVAELVAILETEAKLRDVVAYLPAEAMGFDLRRLADATVTIPSRTRPSAPLQRVLEAMGEADDAFDEFVEGRFVIGSPQTVIEGLERYRDELDTDHVVMRHQWPGMPAADAEASLELFADEVMPAF